MDTPPKATNNRKRSYDGLPAERAVTMEEQPQIMPQTPPGTYNHNHASHFCGRTALHLAAEQANLAIIELLLQAGLDIDARDKEGQSALHVAVLEGHEASVKLLLDKGANRNQQDYDGRTALHWAAEKGNIDIITLLLDYQVAVNSKDLSGRTALHRAIEEGHEDIVRLLLQRGADAKVMVDNRTFVNDFQREYILRS
jgi:ankyrin repeat protein